MKPSVVSPSIISLGARSRVTLALAALFTGLIFLWPLFAGAGSRFAQSEMAPLLFVLLIPMLVGIVIAEISEGGMDAKTVALLGVLSALGAGLRPLGAGSGGVELVFFLIILGGSVFGPGFGFLLGSLTLAVSALITAGVGPWLPYQMLAASWVGLGAGLLPRIEGRWNLALLAAYGAAASVFFGVLMNLSFWPFTLGGDTGLSFIPGAPVVENLRRFLVFNLATSLGWDIGRALTTVAMIVLFGGTVLRTLRRAAHRAAFDAPVTFDESQTSET
jgi:energy-coupling factor transport system substrate-specific component